jgi:hypothetical protein
MRQPLRAIVRWAAIEVLVVQTLVAWLSGRVLWPLLLTWPASWAVYTLAGREGSRHGSLRSALWAGGAVALVAHAVSTARLAFKGLDPSGLESPVQGVVWLLAAALWGAGWGLLGGLIARLNQRRALVAFLIGLAPVVLSMMQLKSSAFSKFVLWPVILLVDVVEHNIGTAANPVQLGTPAYVALATLGFGLSAVLYSAIAYALLAWIQRRRAFGGDLDRVSA